MDHRMNIRAFIGVLTVALLSTSVLGQEIKTPPSPAEMQAMMEKWKEVMTPGEEHKFLSSLTGSWAAETKAWSNGPDAPPSVSKGTVVMKPVLGGRFVLEEMKGTMMDMPYSGLGYFGYDKFKKKYVGLWLDNFSTAISTMEGTTNADRTVLTMEGKSDDPMTGEKDKLMQYVWKFVDRKTHVFEIHDPSMGSDKSLMLQITYRKK
jgi:hypothetical protein